MAKRKIELINKKYNDHLTIKSAKTNVYFDLFCDGVGTQFVVSKEELLDLMEE
jgi:hypothetical protein